MRLLSILLVLFSTSSSAVAYRNVCDHGGYLFDKLKNSILITETVKFRDEIEYKISLPKNFKQFEFTNITLYVYKREPRSPSKSGPRPDKIYEILSTNIETVTSEGNIESVIDMKKAQLDLIDLIVSYRNTQSEFVSDPSGCIYELKRMTEE